MSIEDFDISNHQDVYDDDVDGGGGGGGSDHIISSEDEEDSDDIIYPVHQLRYRESELNENNTRYDNIIAGGSDNDRYIQWIVYSTIAICVSVYVLLVLLEKSFFEKRQKAAATWPLT